MEISGIDDLVKYVDDLSVRCGWSDDVRIPILADLKQIRSRLTDPRLYLGVVGEFSAGKSTFINALLGVELLKEDSLQGTTCAPTFLAAGKWFDAEVVFKDGTSLKYTSTVKPLRHFARKFVDLFGIKRSWLKDVAEAREFINKYTAEEESSCAVERVELTLPIKLPFFSENVVLVDTPGVNAENPRHQEVTESAMRRYCDLVVTLTVATAPCPQSLTAFLHQNETCVRDRCIGLITQFDRVRTAERDRLVRFVQSRFAAEQIGLLGLYAAAPYYVVHPEDADTNDKVAFRDQFPDVAAEILKRLSENKLILMANKTRELLDGVINEHIIPVVKRSRETAEEEIEQIESVRMLPFEDFRDEWIRTSRDRMKSARVSGETIVQFARSCVNGFITQVHDAVKSAKSRPDVVRAYTQGITTTNINRRVVSVAVKEFGRWSSDEAKLRSRCLSEFLTAFVRSYGNIANESNSNLTSEKKRPLKRRPELKCSCDISSRAWRFKLKYLMRMAAWRVGGALVGIVLFAIIMAETNGDGFILASIAALVTIAIAFVIDRGAEVWRARVLSSLELDEKHLYVKLHEALHSSAQAIFDYDLEIVDKTISGYRKYKEVIRKMLAQRERIVSIQQDKVSFAKEALPVLNSTLENMKSILKEK